jgi:hypothetical protein
MIEPETDRAKPSSPVSWIVLVLLMGVAVLLRWRYIQEISLFVDEFVTAWAARNAGTHGLPIFPSGNLYPHGFVFTYLEVPFVLGTFDETLARVPALVVSLAVLPTAYWAGRRLFSDQAGLVAAAAMAVDPDLIIWGGRARMYGLLQLLALLVVYFYYRGLVEDRPALRYGAMALLVVGIFTHAEAAFLLPVLGLVTLVVLPWRRVWRWSVALPFALGGTGAIAFYLVAKYFQPGHLETLEQEGRSYFGLSADLLRGPQAFAPVFTSPHRLAFSLLAVAGLYFLFRPRFDRRSPLTYLYVVLAGFAALLVLLAGATWERDRYLFLVLPFLFLIAGEVSRRLLALLPAGPRVRRWQAVAVAGAAALYVGLVGAPLAYTQEWGYDLAFRYLQDHFEPERGDRLATSMSTAAMLYLGQNDAFAIQQGYEEYVVARPGDGVAADLWTATPMLTTTAELTQLLQTAPRAWFVVDGWRFQTRYEPGFILTVLDQMELVHDERGVMVFRGEGYTPRPEPAFQRGVGTEFDRALALAGFELASTQPEPGEEWEITLNWQALEGAGPAYTAFLHLIAPDGTGVAGIDEPVLKGIYQPDLWPEGKPLSDRHRLPIPSDLPPGRYRLDLGVYPSGEPGQLLPVGAGDRLALAALDIGQKIGLPPEEGTDIDFGPIRLLGYDLDCVAVPNACQVTLHWQAQGPIDRDYTVFVHLVDSEGEIATQDDDVPGDPFFPTSTWLPGRSVLDEHTLAVPQDAPPEEYTVVIGLYHVPTNDRVPATGADGQPLGDAVPLTALPSEPGSP